MSDKGGRDAAVNEYLTDIRAGGDFPALSQQLHEVLDVLRQEETSMQAGAE